MLNYSDSSVAPHPRAGRSAPLLAACVLMAAAALFVRRQTVRAEAANPPRGRFIEVDGVRLHYIERGAGAPLVLLHGNGSMIEELELSGLVDLAAQRYRVIVFDRPGFGHSERPRGRSWTARAQAELLSQALRSLGVEEPAIVVGHSWGTLVAVWMGLLHPEAVARLVLASGYFFPSVRLDVPMFSVPALPIVGDLLRYTFAPIVGRLIKPLLYRRIFAPAPVDPKFNRRFPLWMALRPVSLRAAAAETALMIPTAIRLSRHYAGLQLPVSLVAGVDDRHVSATVQSGGLHRRLPRSRLRLVPGAGHMVHHTRPEAVMAAIDAAPV